jgi:hypothetical protein
MREGAKREEFTTRRVRLEAQRHGEFLNVTKKNVAAFVIPEYLN